MDVISKKCYYGTILETLDPLSISTIDVTPFEVYSKIPGEKCLIMTLEFDTTNFDTILFTLIDFEQSIFIKKGQLVHVLKKWGPEFKIEFDITVKIRPSNRTNIVHFKTGVKNGQYGDRIPEIYLRPNSKFVDVRSAVNGDYNHLFSFEYILNQKYHIVVKQYKDTGNKYIYEIEVNGSTDHSVENQQAQQFSNVKFYACSSWEDGCFTNDFGLFENFELFF